MTMRTQTLPQTMAIDLGMTLPCETNTSHEITGP